MKEKIKIVLKTLNNITKGPNFRIHCDNNLLTEKQNWKKSFYEETFEIDLQKGPHILKIEHFGKNPKDTKNDFKLDVAIQLEELSFNGIKCNLVDLHENYFFTGEWPYPIEKKIKNNLYFGFNGFYHYNFETPSISYVLNQKKKYTKNLSQIDDFEITEDQFIKKLEDFISCEN